MPGALPKVVVVAAVAIGAELVPKLLHLGFLYLVAAGIVAAGVAGTGYLIRQIRRGVRAGRSFASRVHTGIDVIETVPGRLDKIEARLQFGDDRMDAIDKSLSVMADADEHRIKDAVAGDPRSPVDRRAA